MQNSVAPVRRIIANLFLTTPMPMQTAKSNGKYNCLKWREKKERKKKLAVELLLRIHY
jgi:hypothetical protein